MAFLLAYLRVGVHCTQHLVASFSFIFSFALDPDRFVKNTKMMMTFSSAFGEGVNEPKQPEFT